jgi:D-alanine-D-alanine ligase-like ATP-grasp enzyme
MNAKLRHAVIAYETEAAAQARLVAHGFPPDISAEIAVYLAQSTDLPAFMPEISEALAAEGIGVEFVELDDLTRALARPGFVATDSLLWNVNDGIRFYRGSAVPALARLLGVPRYGSSATAQHLCQDKFLSGAVAHAAGLPCPPTLLLEGAETLGRIGDWPEAGPFFVKPNALGAKIGIFADSRCATLDDARDRSARLWQRYRDRAVVQPFVPGDDVRVSFMATGGDVRAQLGIFRLAKDPRSETGGAFMTMRDNETLSGARDTSGARGGFGATREAAFVPTMEDLRADPSAAKTVDAIADAAICLYKAIGLADCFSMDFRIDLRTGKPVFLEFEVCPAVTIYDFQSYLRGMHRLSLGAALAKSFRLAHRRAGGMGEA